MLIGGLGNHRLAGGGGEDLVDCSSVAERVRVSLAIGRLFGDGRDRLREIEEIVGASAATS